MGRATATKDFLAAHPSVDHILPIAALGVWWLIFHLGVPPDLAARQWAYAAVSTVSGLTLAASTFACTMTYQAASPLMVEVREKFGRLLKRNWVAILRSTIVTAFLPVIALLVENASSTVAFGFVIYAALLLGVRFYRSIFWLSITLFFSENRPAKTAPEAPKLRIPARSDTSELSS